MSKKELYGIVLIVVAVAIVFFWQKSMCASCQVSELSNDWKTKSENNVTFSYPETLPTKYIHVFDWPPQAAVVEAPYSCTEAGSEIERAGETMEEIINTHTYCVTKLTEGAAGSIYTQYAYIREVNAKLIAMVFSLRSVQCANYSDPEKTACENERMTFAIDALVDQIFETISTK